MTNTCKYCASPLTKDYFCDYCHIQFRLDDIKQNGERPDAMLSDIPFNESDLRVSTSELIKQKTIYLYYLLGLARKVRSSYFHDTDHTEYTYFERKVWTIENILLERNGFYPTRVNKKLTTSTMKDIATFEKELTKENKETMTHYFTV